MKVDYNDWLKNPIKLFCKCNCNQEIIIRKRYKYDGIPEYIKGHQNRIHTMPESYQKWLDDGKPKVYCQCGCSEEIVITRSHKYDGIPKYINGHNPPWNRGKIKVYSQESIEKIRKGNKNKIISEETKKKMSESKRRENHWNWKGGITDNPYCERWTEELREEIRERDGRVCQNCGKNKEENNNRELSVHHIHYKKEDCYPDLITLCCSCNTNANYNRDYWIKFYMKILEKRGLLNYFGDRI